MKIAYTLATYEIRTEDGTPQNKKDLQEMAKQKNARVLRLMKEKAWIFVSNSELGIFFISRGFRAKSGLSSDERQDLAPDGEFKENFSSALAKIPKYTRDEAYKEC